MVGPIPTHSSRNRRCQKLRLAGTHPGSLWSGGVTRDPQTAPFSTNTCRPVSRVSRVPALREHTTWGAGKCVPTALSTDAIFTPPIMPCSAETQRPHFVPSSGLSQPGDTPFCVSEPWSPHLGTCGDNSCTSKKHARGKRETETKTGALQVKSRLSRVPGNIGLPGFAGSPPLM